MVENAPLATIHANNFMINRLNHLKYKANIDSVAMNIVSLILETLLYIKGGAAYIRYAYYLRGVRIIYVGDDIRSLLSR